jgi:hypothetical protein
MNMNLVKLNPVQYNHSNFAPQFGAVVDLSSTYRFLPENPQKTEGVAFFETICQNLGPDEVLLVEGGNKSSPYVFLANGEDRSLVESLTYAAKQLQSRMPDIAERIFTKIFVHLYETANRVKVDMNNSAYRQVKSAFKLMKHGPMEDKEI